MTHRYSVGIDLGTSNSAVAVTDLETDLVEVVEITQALGPNQVGEKSTLPSALYVPHPEEFPGGGVTVPWQDGCNGAIVGHFARDHGALVPDRLITSAKSWLSNPHVDPRRAVLPWQSTIEQEKLSAFDCSRYYLEHIREGVTYAERIRKREWDLSDSQVVLTVPASFDEVARTLTAEAAEAAGLQNTILLEEPQAAFYAWTDHAGKEWRSQVNPGDIVLVCDIGGGTADFSLIAITERDGSLDLERISVGEHLLLGGDNMDLALAYVLQARLEEEGQSLDNWQFLSLIHSVSTAKIALFSDDELGEVPLSIPSRGSSLFAGTISTSLERSTLEQIILDGFFPITAVSDLPQETKSAALQEFGLPFAADPVVSKHLARFLTRSLTNVRASETLRELVGSHADTGTFLAPTAVLFNGGVFKAAPVRRRILDLLASWTEGDRVRELEGFEPDLAVAKGASVYGRNRVTGKGIRIKAGAARSYYVGLETSMPAVPGFKPPVKALCVVPQGMEEGTDLLIDRQEFGLITGQTAEFRFFSSEIRSGDEPGQLLPNAEKELEETSHLEIELPPLEGYPAGEIVPVQINALVTELGILELWMKHTQSDQRWKVEFQVRTE